VITAITGSRFLLAGRSSAKWKFYFFMTAQLLAGYLTYSGMLSLYPLAASIIGTVAVFFFSNANMRIAMGACSVIWIVHNYLAGSPVAVVTEVVFLGSNIVGFIRLRNRWIAIR
jgi:Bacterial inner membrane protein